MVQKFQCFRDPSTACDADLRLSMSKFLNCFEGTVIDEGHCEHTNASSCADTAGWDAAVYTDIMSCVSDKVRMAQAAAAMDKVCSAKSPKSWPTVVINDKDLCEDDSCFMPLLPVLCKNYKSSPKPKSCARFA